ncbi:TadE family type IV pilus minor pilin [Arthrobacter bussei]|uniref:Pilus assembly protein TadE n=1 Tax=Arthrobacter bussei TaxID=2594179 RepID=A0A7X1NNN9_9MICC|nr:TadE family type IV pilus minor pilin [Arthrobacter bussei]MPY10084.1 pilus assembly protein TadE [Arthrobacter bussei]
MRRDQGGSDGGHVGARAAPGVDPARDPARVLQSFDHTRVQGRECFERGSVTAEVAVVVPALVLLAGLLLGIGHVGVLQLRIDEAARAGAREAVRGESSASVQQTVRRLAGEGAVASIESRGGWTTVHVRAEVVGPVVDLMDIDLIASASGREEANG